MEFSYQKLWNILTERRMTRSELREQAGITTNAMVKLGKNQSVQVEILGKICCVLNCTLDDIVSIESDYITEIRIDEFTSVTQYRTLGLSKTDDFPLPHTPKAIQEILECYCASSKLTVDACTELVDALRDKGVRITFPDGIIPDINYIPQTFAQFEDETEEIKAIVYQQLENYIAWSMRNANLSEEQLLILSNENTPKSAVCDSCDIYPLNLLMAIFGYGAIRILHSVDEAKSAVAEVIDTLSTDEQYWIKLKYVYGISSNQLLEILKLPDYETLLWAIDNNRYVNKALRKLRHPSRSKYLRSLIEFDEPCIMPVPPMPIPEEVRIRKIKELSIEELDLSVRTLNCLKRAGALTVADILQLSSVEILQIQNISRKVIDEIEETLKNLKIPVERDVREVFIGAKMMLE